MGPVLLCILVLLVIAITGMAIFIKRKQPASANDRKLLKMYILLFRLSKTINSAGLPPLEIL